MMSRELNFPVTGQRRGEELYLWIRYDIDIICGNYYTFRVIFLHWRDGAGGRDGENSRG